MDRSHINFGDLLFSKHYSQKRTIRPQVEMFSLHVWRGACSALIAVQKKNTESKPNWVVQSDNCCLFIISSRIEGIKGNGQQSKQMSMLSILV